MHLFLGKNATKLILSRAVWVYCPRTSGWLGKWLTYLNVEQYRGLSAIIYVAIWRTVILANLQAMSSWKWPDFKEFTQYRGKPIKTLFMMAQVISAYPSANCF